MARVWSRRRPAGHRPRPRAPQLGRRRGRRRRRAGRRLPARRARAGARLRRRPDAAQRRRGRPGHAAPDRGGLPRGCTPGRGSPATSTCSRCSAATWPWRPAGFRVPAGYAALMPRFDAARRALAVRAGRHRAVQQRPARGQLHRRRRAHLADRLRVLRQQRPVLRARQHRRRVRAAPGRASPSWSGLTTAGRCATRSPGPGSSAWWASTAGPCGALSSRPAARSRSTSGPGHGTFRIGGRRADQPGVRPVAG